MHIPRITISAFPAARQSSADLLPLNYCLPQCPSCKTEILAFDNNTSCVANSPFITNCGSCQQCIITYTITNGEQNTSSALEEFMVDAINMCADSPISSQVAGLQAQASRLGGYIATAALITTTTAATPTGGSTITSAPAAVTGTSTWECLTATPGDLFCSSLLATASWASYYYARQSAESALSVASASAAYASKTATVTSYTPKATPTTSSSPAPSLNHSWIAGPVVGSILGIATVVAVVYLTKRKQAKATAAQQPAKDINDNDSLHSSQVKAQLHSECIPVMELDNCEVVPPVELPAMEPVGSELSTPRDAKNPSEEEWAAPPMSPLREIFASVELRDERLGHQTPKQHDTFYHS